MSGDLTISIGRRGISRRFLRSRQSYYRYIAQLTKHLITFYFLFLFFLDWLFAPHWSILRLHVLISIMVDRNKAESRVNP